MDWFIKQVPPEAQYVWDIKVFSEQLLEELRDSQIQARKLAFQEGRTETKNWTLEREDPKTIGVEITVISERGEASQEVAW